MSVVLSYFGFIPTNFTFTCSRNGTYLSILIWQTVSISSHVGMYSPSITLHIFRAPALYTFWELSSVIMSCFICIYFIAVNSWTSIQLSGLILEPVSILLQKVEQEAFTKVNIIIYNLFSVEVPKQCQWFWRIIVH